MIMKFMRCCAIAIALTATVPLSAQGVVQQVGKVVAGDVTAWWANGQIYDGGVLPLPNTTNRWTAKQTFGPGTTNAAPIGILPGIAPSAPVNGDVWTTPTGLFVRLNGATLQIAAQQAVDETPSGLIDYSNVTYTIAHTPINSIIMLYYNGILLEAGAGNDYTLSGTTITMLYALPTGTKLRAYYSY